MNGFLYYWSTEKATDGENLRSLGIPIETFRVAQLMRGPNGKQGFLLCESKLSESDFKAVYSEDDQVWRECVPIGKEGSNEDLWIGMYRDFPPTPNDLEVDRLTPGQDVVLGDGKKWHVPHCRVIQYDPPSTTCGLPQVYRHSRDGWQIEPAIEYAELWAQLGMWFKDCHEAVSEQSAGFKEGDVVELNDDRPTVGDSLDWAIRTLSLNYRVSRPELSLLGVFSGRGVQAADMTEMKEILDIASGWSGFLDYILKKTPEEQIPVG